MRLIVLIFLTFSCIPVFANPAPVILVLGDSLSAGYGLERLDRGWVSLLQDRLKAERYPHRVVNASISGDTTSNGRSRIDQALAEHDPQTVIVELGGNDGLRGLSPRAMQENLRYIVERSRESGAKVLLLGMRIPPNYGPAYTQMFERVYAELAAELDLNWVPFFLDGVAENRDLMQADGIHPTAAAQPIMLGNVYPDLAPLLKQTAARIESTRVRSLP